MKAVGFVCGVGLALAGCDVSAVVRPGFALPGALSQASPLALQRAATISFGISPAIATADVKPVSFVALPVCDAAAAVLGHGLGSTYSCVPGSGLVSMYYPSGSGSGLFDAFRRAILAAGGSVTFSGSGIVVVGGDGDVSAQRTTGGPSFGDDESGGEVSVIVAPPTELLDTIARAGAVFPQLVIERAPVGASAEELAALADEFGANLSAFDVNGSTFVSYTRDAVTDALLGIARGQERSVVVLPVAEPSADAIDSLLIDYPGVTATWDVSGLSVVGSPFDVRSFVAAARPLLSYRRDFRVAASFLSFSSDSSRTIGAVVSGGVALGDNVQLGISSSGQTLSVLVDGAVSSGSASVVSRPSIVVSSGSAGTFSSGSQIPVVTSVTNDGVTSDVVEFVDTGVNLVVTPRPLPEGIRLEISLSISSVSDQAGVDGLPIFNRESYSGVIVVRPGSVLVISGLRDISESQRAGWGLRSIRSRSKTERELQILMTVN